MNYRTIFENWQRYTRQPTRVDRRKALEENIKVLREVSASSAAKIKDWMKDASVMDYSFNDMFDGKMRITFPMDSADTRNLRIVGTVLKDAGWRPPVSAKALSDISGIPVTDKGAPMVARRMELTKGNEINPKRYRGFSTKKVIQKMTRLAVDGGGEYEKEIEVADLNLERTYDFVIPAGPKQGEKIMRTDRSGISKALQRLSKEGKIDPELVQWWQKKQTHYTKENNHRVLENLLLETAPEEVYHVILSRHPIDVLRMSDVSNISSCHSEGSSHFHCAMAEARGHGPIAWLVTEDELNKLLKPSEEPDPVAKYNRLKNSLDNAEMVTRMRQDYDLESPGGVQVYLFTWSRSDDGQKWISEFDQRVKMASHPEKFREVMVIAKAKALWVNPLMFKKWVKNIEDDKPMHTDIISDEEYSEAIEKHAANLTNQPDNDLSNLDDQEIFADRQRGVSGIQAKSRVRLRKYIDDQNDLTFAGVERRIYGAKIPGFHGAVVEKAWELQKKQFESLLGDESDGPPEERTVYFVPDMSNLTRYGGSYADNNDGAMLNDLFGQAGKTYDSRFTESEDAYHEEDEDEDEGLWNQYEEQVEELSSTYNNRMNHCSVYGEVGGDEQPYVYGSGDMSIDIDLGFVGPVDAEGDGYYFPNDDRDYAVIPTGGSWHHRDFVDLLEPKNGYAEETEWSLNDPDAGEAVILTVRYSFTCEDCDTPNSFENFCDYIEDDLDKNYDEIVEQVRRKLVSEEYALPSEWDNLQSEIENMEDELEHFSVIADDPDDPSGEAWFSIKDNERHGDTDVLLADSWSGSKMYWLTKHPRMNMSTVSRRAGRIGMFRAMLAGKIYAGGEAQRVIVLDSEISTVFSRNFSSKLRKLEAAANKYAMTQLHLDFGEKFKQPEYDGIQFAKNTEMALKLGGKESDPDATVPIFFRLKIIAGQKNTKEELEGAFHFIKFVDQHFDMIMQAANETMRFIVETELAVAEEYKEYYLSGTYAKELTDKIRSAIEGFSPIDVRASPGTVPYAKRTIARKQHAILDFFETKWSKFSVFEREVAIDKYLKRMENAMLVEMNPGEIQWDDVSHVPMGWTRTMKDWMREGGYVPHVTWNAYTAPAAPEITEKYFSEQQRAKDAHEAEHHRRQLSGLPPVRDAEVNEPPEGLQERIGRLRNHLTETQIRVTIRQVLKKHGVI